MTFASFHPCALAGGSGVAVIVGSDVSMFNVTEAVATLPALSVTVRETVWFAPSPLMVAGSGQDSTPAPASPHSNDTTTALLFQPSALGAGDAAAVIVAAVLSTLTTTDVVATFPA